jgi:hypothetical protein
MNILTDHEEFKHRKRGAKLKNDILMEEPCPIYEATDEDWEDFWYNEDN